MDSIEQRVKEILNENFAIDWPQLQADNLVIGEHLDSLEVVEFAILLEESFGVEIPDDEFKPAMTIEQVVSKVKELKAR